MTAPQVIACVTDHYPQIYYRFHDATRCKCGARWWPGNAIRLDVLPSAPVALPASGGAQ